jgi:CheY-like chemotaxis protein
MARHERTKRRGAAMIAGDRILVVDDSDSVRRILAEALEGEGYRVYTASDGRRAWDLLRQYPFFYDLVISDVMMPAMNGLELLRRTIANFPWVKVILVTGSRDPDLTATAQALGAAAILTKPSSLEEIHRTLRLALVR